MSNKILICDDDQGILEMLTFILEDYGFEVLSEINSLNIYKHISTDQPDLLLIDLWMPVLSGDQIIRTIKNDTNQLNLPIIVISASLEGKKIAEESGANEFVAKPFSIDELIEKINKLL